MDIDKKLLEASEEYADRMLKQADPELAACGYQRHTKMGVHIFNGSDLEEAFINGAEWQQKQTENTEQK